MAASHVVSDEREDSEEDEGARVHAKLIKDVDVKEDDILLFPIDELTAEGLPKNTVFNEYVKRAVPPKYAIVFKQDLESGNWLLRDDGKKRELFARWFEANESAIVPLLNERAYSDDEGGMYADININKHNARVDPEFRIPYPVTVMDDILANQTITLEGRRYIKFPGLNYLRLKKEMLGTDVIAINVFVIAVEGESWGEYFSHQDVVEEVSEFFDAKDPKFYFAVTLSLKYDGLRLGYNGKRKTMSVLEAMAPSTRVHYLLHKDKIFAHVERLRVALLELSSKFPQVVHVAIDDGEMETYSVCAIVLELLLQKHQLASPDYQSYIPQLIDVILGGACADKLINEDGRGELFAETATLGAQVYAYLTSA
jgi:hypothetical protein